MDISEKVAGPARKPRVDSQRNRLRVLEAAKAVFSRGGEGASLEAVVREAGVGIGTLYRHFPTREALFEAVYRREVEELADLAERLNAEGVAPVDALRRWFAACIDFVATKKGMVAALAIAAGSTGNLNAYSSDRLAKAVGLLLDRAVASRDIRADVGAGDLMRTLIGMCYLNDRQGWRESVAKMMGVLLDGMRLTA